MKVYILQTMSNSPKGIWMDCTVFQSRAAAQSELERRWTLKCRELEINAEMIGRETWCHENYATIDLKGYYIQWNIHEQELA
jgi:hypothetical protein